MFQKIYARNIRFKYRMRLVEIFLFIFTKNVIPLRLSPVTPTPFVVSSNYRTSPLANISNSLKIDDFIDDSRFNVTEGFTLNTCNRNEVYGIINLSVDTCARLKDVVGHNCTVDIGADAVYHLTKVVSGLDSLFPMDNHVKHQSVQSFQNTYRSSSDKRHFPKIWNSVVKKSKRVRTTRKSSDTMMTWIFDNIGTSENVVIVGAGVTGRACEYHLRRHYKVEVFNRTPRVVGGKDTLGLRSLGERVRELDRPTIVHCADFPLADILDADAFVESTVVDLTQPSQTMDILGAKRLVDVAASNPINTGRQQDDDVAKDLQEFAQTVMFELHIGKILARECLNINRQIERSESKEDRLSLLRTRHELIQRIRAAELLQHPQAEFERAQISS